MIDDPVYQAVCRAWQQTLPNVALHPTLGWADAGADSLETLHLILRLEKYLGRRIPFDVVTPEITVLELARQLTATDPATPSSAMPVFMVPPLFGDEPILAAFRRSLSRDIEMRTVDLPDLEQPAAILGDIAATGRYIADAIARQHPTGTIVLTGYSYGASVAFEVAAALVETGRTVAALALLDPIPPRFSRGAIKIGRRFVSGARRTFRRDGASLKRYLNWLGFALPALVESRDRTREKLVAARDILDTPDLVRRRKWLLFRIRYRSIQEWRPRPLDVPVLLATSDELVAAGSLGIWPTLCPRMELLRIPGGHRTIFEPPALERLNPRFEAVVAGAHGGGEALYA